MPAPRRTAVLVALTLTTGLMVALPAGPATASPITGRTETVLETDGRIQVSHVSLTSPLPNANPHPAACDAIGYLRYRDTAGPADPQQADSVVVSQQGTFGNAYNSDSVARNTVRSAIAAGKHLEYWSLARRGNCLNDDTGINAALRARDYRVALNYYYRGTTIDGHRFAGYDAVKNSPFLADLGLERTLRDQYDLMLHELPSQHVRQTKAFCTGISMGGLVTGLFASWDFDGNPATTADAGFNQCAGFAAQDTILPSDPVQLKADPLLGFVSNLLVGTTHQAASAAFRNGTLPRTLAGVPALGPEGFHLQRMAGLAAYLAPEAETDVLSYLPNDPATKLGERILYAPSYTEFVTGLNGLRSFRYTNEALLGTLVDNNSVNIGLFQVSVGALSGGPVRPKTFPLPGQVSEIPIAGGLLSAVAGPSPRVAPLSTRALYTWKNFNEVSGVSFTAPDQEATDIRDLARQLAQGSPIGYWEENFPVKLLADIIFAFGGARDGELANVRYENAARDTTKPTVTLLAGNSSVRHATAIFLPGATTVIPGYTHIDTINAAAVQNDGRPDPSGQLLADFVLASS
ncbi:hypothetical protein E1263_02660 [Kribbella antibiotica]|uniref:Alpha/beta hydrolase n=1 Tax=Kribbella antibiotica TaxID=190195 RepID=A0A4R4ZWA2_9ACTN|nr:hypothetical protein [Kribbella antibiotica]TDD62636.1 hypothetical protein E1263_02660 [Kribbella antibiotica]